MLFTNANREVLSGSRIRMRTAGRGQDVCPEKTLYLNLEERLICRLHRQEFHPATKYLGLNFAPPPPTILSNILPNYV